MQARSHRSQNHRIHTDIQPVISALKHGKTRIAQLRFTNLCVQLNLMKWEGGVVRDIIQAKCRELGISMAKS